MTNQAIQTPPPPPPPNPYEELRLEYNDLVERYNDLNGLYRERGNEIDKLSNKNWKQYEELSDLRNKARQAFIEAYPEAELLTGTEVAAILRCTYHAVYDLYRSNELPGFTINRRTRYYRPADVAKVIADKSAKVMTYDERKKAEAEAQARWEAQFKQPPVKEAA